MLPPIKFAHGHVGSHKVKMCQDGEVSSGLMKTGQLMSVILMFVVE